MTALAAGHVLAAGFAVSGAHGILILIAFLLFTVAAILAWFIAPRAIYATFMAAGLALYMLALLVTG